MNLILFDIDGTLTQTNAVDSEVLTDVLQKELDIAYLNNNWTDYKYSTDRHCASTTRAYSRRGKAHRKSVCRSAARKFSQGPLQLLTCGWCRAYF